MNNWRMIVEEILPFYFFIMVMPIVFIDYVPTKFELIIVYMFGFGVALFNNSLYKKNTEYQVWGEEVVDVVDALHQENKYLRSKLEEVIDELEEIEYEMDTENSQEEATK